MSPLSKAKMSLFHQKRRDDDKGGHHDESKRSGAVASASTNGRHPRGQAVAAQQLGVSVRHVKRLVQRYRTQGAAGLVSWRRGQRPPNALAPALREEALAVVRERYPDFAPTLAHEKLTEHHGYTFSVETLRQWLITAGLWQPQRRRGPRVHPRRPRRSCVGELGQIDGSPHDWFEGRAPACTLIVFIDDATSQLMALRFVPAETTQAYMETLQSYLAQYGRPGALYSDQHSIFRINHEEREGERTQFTRALETLDIAPIHAHTPQAKGRVERAHQTLQDRLVKELRLHGLSTLAAANAWVPTFMAAYNRRFAGPPASPVDVHRPVLHSPPDLARIFALHHPRIIAKTLSVQFQNRTDQFQGYGQGYRLRGAPVTVCEAFDGSIELLHEGRALAYRLLTEGPAPIPVETEKTLALRLATIRQAQRRRPRYKPAPEHPWRQPFRPSSAPPPPS